MVHLVKQTSVVKKGANVVGQLIQDLPVQILGTLGVTAPIMQHFGIIV